MRCVPSRYRPESASDYSHRFHAGNVGDVWKHCVLVEVLRRAASAAERVSYVESHAGEGGYALGPTGEWTEGIGRLWRSADAGDADDGAVARYVSLARRFGSGDARPERYPGSPVLAQAVLGARARLALWEQDEAAAARLQSALAGDVDLDLVCGDGLAALPAALVDAEARGERAIALVDPPFTQKPDWTAIPDAVVAAAQATRTATLVLWYPVKSLTRPNAMIARFRTAGVSGTIAELITTPLEHQRQRLNGSGLLVVRPPAGAVAAVAAAAPTIGARCATRPGVWSLRVKAW
jgi:23S rRNA (adenine2030-N6)-methyltransferase